MSYKHTKHWDSEVSRSLEKLAIQKGMVKPEPLQKQASMDKKADITPTSDLMENIFKLCNGLRSEGFTKQAEEIETNFLNYKQAQTLYETSKEEGEDLVHAAHPKGSHKLEDVDSDEAVVEDILDKQKKIKEVVEKKPTGKLSNAKSIINAVKLALADQQSDSKSYKLITNQVKIIANWIAQTCNPELSIPITNFTNNIVSSVKKFTVYDLNFAKVQLDGLKERLQPNILSRTFNADSISPTALNNYTWNRISPKIDDIESLINQAIEISKRFDERKMEAFTKNQEIVEDVSPNNTDTISKDIAIAIDNFTKAKSIVKTNDPKEADIVAKTQAWLDKRISLLNTLKQTVANDTNKSNLAAYQQKLTQYSAGLDNIFKEWTK